VIDETSKREKNPREKKALDPETKMGQTPRECFPGDREQMLVDDAEVEVHHEDTETDPTAKGIDVESTWGRINHLGSSRPKAPEKRMMRRSFLTILPMGSIRRENHSFQYNTFPSKEYCLGSILLSSFQAKPQVDSV
jgi:hypothetical protein